MPHSSVQNKKPIKELLFKFQAKNILELGAGLGDFGWIVRKYLPQAKLYGVEIFRPNFEALPVCCYSALLCHDIRDLDYKALVKMWRIDTVLAIDVLEHLPRYDSKAVLSFIEETGVRVLVSVPIIPMEQGAVGGNEYERHVDQWTIEEMEALGYKLFFRGRIIGVFFKERA